MKTIPLLCGQRFALVDDDIFSELGHLRWYWRPTRNGHGAVVRTIGNGAHELLHRRIVGAADGLVVDHRDTNPLNNQRENLRVCTQAQNLRNRRKFSNSSSPFKGVTRTSRERKPWTAQIRANGKMRYLGMFDTAEEAAQAYDRAASESFGQFARLNFPGGAA